MHHASFATFNRSQHTCMPVSPYAAVSFPYTCSVYIACFVKDVMQFDVAELAKLEGIPGSLSTLGDQAEEVYKPR